MFAGGATVVEDAAARDGIELYVSTQAALGIPVPASLLVSVEAGDPAPVVQLPVTRMADTIRARYAQEADTSVVSLPAAEAVRCRRQETSRDARELGQPADRPGTLLDFYLPIPGSGGWLVLSTCFRTLSSQGWQCGLRRPPGRLPRRPTRAYSASTSVIRARTAGSSERFAGNLVDESMTAETICSTVTAAPFRSAPLRSAPLKSASGSSVPPNGGP